MKKKSIGLLVTAFLGSLVLTGCSFILDYHGGDNVDIDTGGEPAEEFKGEKTALKYRSKHVSENNVYGLDYCPTIGSVKLLVIPVWFSDSNAFIATANKEVVREDIRKAYFGTNEETGWRSVKTFYEEESLGKLKMSGTVSEWYETGSKHTAYASESAGANNTMSLVKTATKWFFDNHPEEKRTDYDADKDGELDGVLLIYAAPDYASYGKESYKNLWAYCYWLVEYEPNVKAPVPNAYFWASYDFLYSRDKSYAQTGKSYYGSGDNSHCEIDAHTFIHEMGHVFGLDDYYDYGPNYYSPAAGFSMQDNNVGGHDPYSTMAFGWTDPYVVTSSCSLTIKPFQKNHDLVVLTNKWNTNDSPFDEYLAFELFTPTGLNELDCKYSYNGAIKGPNATGIRVWHVDSRLLYFDELDKNDEIMVEENNITTSPVYIPQEGKEAPDFYYVCNAFSNTSDEEDYGTILGEDYDKYDLLHLIRNNTRETYGATSNLAATDLFGTGSYSLSTYSRQFPNGSKFDSSELGKLNWDFKVKITGSGDSASATLTFTKK